MSLRPIAIALAVLAAGAVLYLWPRGPKNPEDQIKALIAECVVDANNRAVGDIMEHVAEDFIGPQMSRKQDVKQALAYQLLRQQQDIAVILNPTLNVDLKSETTAGVVGFFVFGRTKAKTAEELSQSAVAAVYKIEADLERRDGRWTFTSAKYSQVNGW